MTPKYRIEILLPSCERDESGEISGDTSLFRTLWAERTESGGRDNLYASRMVHENEVVYSIRWMHGLKPSMLLKDGSDIRSIVSIHEEGFRNRLHIKVTKSDAPYEANH